MDAYAANTDRLGLALRDSHPGFDPLQAIERYDEDSDFAETEQY